MQLNEKIHSVLERKGRGLFSVAPNISVFDALREMADKDVGALAVIGEEELIGIFSERDYARKVILKGRSSKTTTVGELMITDVLYVSPDDTIENCMALMTDKRLRHLPVMENGKLAGIISIGDIVRVIISDREFTIRELERYITGGHSSRG